jgi:hypothetical protein
MERIFSRRHFLGTATAAGAALVAGRLVHAHDWPYEPGATGGIGFPKEQFESIYGAGAPVGDLLAYPNPYLDGSALFVMFEDGVAIFVEMSIPDGLNISQDDAAPLLQNLMPQDAGSIAEWVIGNSDIGVPTFVFNELDAPSMHMAGSGATRMQTCVATTTKGNLVRMAVSLAIPNGAHQFAPAKGSIGVGDSGGAWRRMYGEGHDGTGAMGTYSVLYDVAPWDAVEVRSHRTENKNTILTMIVARSEGGVAEKQGVAFAEQILPQSAQLQTAYEAFAIPDRPQGWGSSTWALPDQQLAILFILGAGDGSGHVVEVGSALA